MNKWKAKTVKENACGLGGLFLVIRASASIYSNGYDSWI